MSPALPAPARITALEAAARTGHARTGGGSCGRREDGAIA